MIEVRVKDKVFLAIAVPAAAVAVYCGWWRPAQASRLAALESRDRVTVSETSFPSERRIRSAALRSAEAELAAEEAVKPPAAEVVADRSDSAAERMRGTVETFRRAGVRVLRSVFAGDAASGAAADALRATGTRPSPVKRRYLLEGGYGALCGALQGFSVAKAAVIVGSVKSAGAGKWEVEIYE